mmetsp:Transcript_50043/g.161988  ORF Transcript_50043/g.161988 Transcript_50043/m.161988 type:complete len:140 (-) Transcript_50043:171-590(-)|eukprot:CAMPEP_0203963718 /NCGR_PEP_ID=MMETSP0359-20131031/93614_1 /ASSEMBLY_ACC=CAM_ASM_000338 /TAXON_ID=268821 /ORGANISM="Scrippsiella Hangoei, Strain SHTV-5" /LENGTH=139 /DNA_ID=CAMNT_0050899727 /DNA_START=79 /DNA_END=498 /DNA_ORIENTATION=-
MGASCGTATDAYGYTIEVDAWVEPTSTYGGEWGWKAARVQKISDNGVTLEWPGWNPVLYGAKDIKYYGLKRIMVDKKGTKLMVNQSIKGAAGSKGVVTACGDKEAVIAFNNEMRTYKQQDIDYYGIVVVQSRSCGRTCA